jgi:hypothetical protein
MTIYGPTAQLNNNCAKTYFCQAQLQLAISIEIELRLALFLTNPTHPPTPPPELGTAQPQLVYYSVDLSKRLIIIF